MDNIELFDRCTASIFAKLYTNFPVPVDLEFLEMESGIFDEDDADRDAMDKFIVYEHTINWLISAGYIHAKRVTNDGACEAVLSPKGLEILKIPSSLENGQSFGEQITSAAKSGAIELAVSGAKAAISKGILYLMINA